MSRELDLYLLLGHDSELRGPQRKERICSEMYLQVGNINVPSNGHESFYQLFPLLGKIDECGF